MRGERREEGSPFASPITKVWIRQLRLDHKTAHALTALSVLSPFRSRNVDNLAIAVKNLSRVLCIELSVIVTVILLIANIRLEFLPTALTRKIMQ